MATRDKVRGQQGEAGDSPDSGALERGENSSWAMLAHATPETIWQVPAYLPYLQPPLTDRAVASAETKIGHRLPAAYLRLLRKQNGGYIRFSLPEMIHDQIAGIGPHFPSLTEHDWGEGQAWVSFPLQGLVPFDGDGHWYICLDYRKSPATPSVTYVDIECDHQSGVGGSFTDYLAKLRVEVDEEYVLESVADIEAVKSHLSSALSTEFYPPDCRAHGYPMHRAQLGTGASPEWVWMSPNTVPRGFVRPNDPRYRELKDLMPGTADRFPGLPADSYILKTTDGVRSDVILACLQSRVSIRPLREYVKGMNSPEKE